MDCSELNELNAKTVFNHQDINVPTTGLKIHGSIIKLLILLYYRSC